MGETLEGVGSNNIIKYYKQIGGKTGNTINVFFWGLISVQTIIVDLLCLTRFEGKETSPSGSWQYLCQTICHKELPHRNSIS